MAAINQHGQILARCTSCHGAVSRFEYHQGGSEFGVITVSNPPQQWPYRSAEHFQFRLYRCVGCGMGALGIVQMKREGAGYPAEVDELAYFHPEAAESLPLPADVPPDIEAEFREAERCLAAGCFRAAAALFRSTLDKTLSENGYRKSSLKARIDEAAKDGVITAARKARAHDEIRVFGNDILHEKWRELAAEDVEPAHRYTQKILDDLYDDRETVVKQLNEAKRLPAKSPERASG